MLEPTKRFTARVGDYVQHRPGYPDAVIGYLREVCGLTAAWTVADIGSGTGISTALFVRNGNRTYAVEPNAAMRQAAESALGTHPAFVSVDGTAEATTLPDCCVDLVAAGQAFHWFNIALARQEFLRILKPGGWVALFWNDRRVGGTPFMAAYEQLLQDYAPEYPRVNHRLVDRDTLERFFAPHAFMAFSCEHDQAFDLAGLQGRLQSSSYTPTAEHPAYAPMQERLAQIFAANQEDGMVRFLYDTRVYVGRLGA